MQGKQRNEQIELSRTEQLVTYHKSILVYQLLN